MKVYKVKNVSFSYIFTPRQFTDTQILKTTKISFKIIYFIKNDASLAVTKQYYFKSFLRISFLIF